MNRKIVVLVVLVAATILLIVAATVKTFNSGSKQGTVTLVYNLADSNDTTVTFNGKKVTPTKGTKSTYAVAVGTYTLKVSRFGFIDFSVSSLRVAANQPLTVNVQLTLVSDSTITSLAQIPVLQNSPIPGEQITEARYYYNKTWAVLNLAAPGTDNATVVVSYNPVSAIWSPILGPGTLFRPSNIRQLPPLVQADLTNRGVVNPGGSNNNE